MSLFSLRSTLARKAAVKLARRGRDTSADRLVRHLQKGQAKGLSVSDTLLQSDRSKPKRRGVSPSGFVIKSELGKGSFHRVHEVEDMLTGQTFAVREPFRAEPLVGKKSGITYEPDTEKQRLAAALYRRHGIHVPEEREVGNGVSIMEVVEGQELEGKTKLLKDAIPGDRALAEQVFTSAALDKLLQRFDVWNGRNKFLVKNANGTHSLVDMDLDLTFTVPHEVPVVSPQVINAAMKEVGGKEAALDLINTTVTSALKQARREGFAPQYIKAMEDNANTMGKSSLLEVLQNSDKILPYPTKPSAETLKFRRKIVPLSPGKVVFKRIVPVSPALPTPSLGWSAE